jgi:CheY-like chemotaxis protein
MPPSSTPLDDVKDDHDDLVFLEEQAVAGAGSGNGAVWRVMIVDDDEDVHSTTTFALGNLDMQHRPLEFVHAYSAAQAREMLREETDIAVILLDVVMEQDDAGLHLVRYIRETLKLADVRIILRTGQPGYAPEIDAIRDFDINDYKTKSELTRIKLYTTVTAAIRSYEQIRAIDSSRHGLDQIVRASTELMSLHGVHDFASGVLARHPRRRAGRRAVRARPGRPARVAPAGDGLRRLVLRPRRRRAHQRPRRARRQRGRARPGTARQHLRAGIRGTLLRRQIGP